MRERVFDLIAINLNKIENTEFSIFKEFFEPIKYINLSVIEFFWLAWSRARQGICRAQKLSKRISLHIYLVQKTGFDSFA